VGNSCPLRSKQRTEPCPTPQPLSPRMGRTNVTTGGAKRNPWNSCSFKTRPGWAGGNPPTRPRSIEHIPLDKLYAVGPQQLQKLRLEILSLVMLGLPRDVLLNGLFLRFADRKRRVPLLPRKPTEPGGTSRGPTSTIAL